MDQDAFDAGVAGSVLQPLITHHCACLRAGRYAPNTIRVCMRCAAQFAHRLGTEKIARSAVNKTTGMRFLAGHLARCDCPAPVRRVIHEHRVARASFGL
jgi:integrase/recombinase XerD